MKNIRIFIAFMAISLIVGLRFSPLRDYLTFANLVAQKENLHNLAANNYILFSLAYILIYIAAVAVSFPGAFVLTMAGGFVFGVVATTVYVNIAATLGACGAFLAARYLLGEQLQKKYSAGLKRFNKELKSNGVNYLLTLRLIPIFPFFLINIFSGLTRIGLPTFAWTTSLGIIPGTAVYAFAGSQLNYVKSPKDILSKEILLAFLALGLFALVPVIYRKFKAR